MQLYPYLLEIVPAGQKMMRLDLFVSTRHGYSRSAIGNLCRSNLLLVNGISSKPAQKVRAGDRLELLKQYAEYGKRDQPADIPLDIIFEDEFLIVINKAAGMAVHAGLGDHGNTLVNALIHHWKGESQPFLVHRLDKFTSGLIVVAKQGSKAETLAESFAQRKAGRIYTALIHGHIKTKEGRIESFIGRNPLRPDSIEVSTDQRFGKQAITHYQFLETWGPYSLIQVKLETGRTHQIRVHMQAMGHPLAGDRRYPCNKPGFNDDSEAIAQLIPGQALHATELNFIHPVNAINMHFSADLPRAFANLHNYLKNKG